MRVSRNQLTTNEGENSVLGRVWRNFRSGARLDRGMISFWRASVENVSAGFPRHISCEKRSAHMRSGCEIMLPTTSVRRGARELLKISIFLPRQEVNCNNPFVTRPCFQPGGEKGLGSTFENACQSVLLYY